MTVIQRAYFKWLGYNEYEIEERQAELDKGEEPLCFEGNQFYAWESGYNECKEYAKTIIKGLLDNSDEYARQRAEDFLKEN